MAFYQILSWGGIPSQLKVWDDAEEIKIEMPPRFMARIDAAAQAKGLTSTDDYLEQWSWSEELERHGSAPQVASLLLAELERQFP